jgi:hypothetical protein
MVAAKVSTCSAQASRVHRRRPGFGYPRAVLLPRKKGTPLVVKLRQWFARSVEKKQKKREGQQEMAIFHGSIAVLNGLPLIVRK